MAAELCDPEGQVARWLERLAVFDFEVVHQSGRKHQNADVLSRRFCKQCGLEGSPVEVPVGALQLNAANPIKQWQESDKELQQIREWSTQRTWPLVAPEGSRLTRSFWSQRDRIVVPKGTICRKWETPDTGETRLLQVILRQRIPKILAAVTNRQSGAHWGLGKTLPKLRQQYYWPQQREDVEDWCWACQTSKAFIDHPDDWDAHLDRVLLAYQSSAHHTTGATRSRVIFRREMRLPVDLVYSLPRGAPEESVGEHTRRMRQDLKQLYKAVRGRAGREQRRQKFWKDRKAHRPVPYEVQKKQVWNTYWVKEMKGRRWRLVVHFDRLKPYQGSRQHGVGQQKPRGKRKTQIPTWVRDFMHDPGDEHGTCS
ncbi:Gypsy retrotransposon integrase-like protein [Trichinella pseudospiralis]